MKQHLRKHLGPSWRTTALGLLAMLLSAACFGLGAWSFHVVWIPSQTLMFNLVYAEHGPIGELAAGLFGMAAGWGLLHAKDHNCDSQ